MAANFVTTKDSLGASQICTDFLIFLILDKEIISAYLRLQAEMRLSANF
ncbi:hypothetical protein N44_02114 [Microcystis aeruginosa NIES-44]|uniref:Uncharacterized protein n=1 Tax=Microcystis aeruginosa NIES-44 TaxID=449439 RepID=A0A0A1VUG6_MICAE|nr:hypothetical protein N44_02114 [Microcystis aeruginosa NIES-44]